MASSAATNGPHLVCRIPACKMARASGARLSSQEISFICYLVGRRLGGSAVGILAPRTLLAEMTSAMGRKKEEGRKEGRKEGGKGKDGSPRIERERERASEAFFLIAAPAIPLAVVVPSAPLVTLLFSRVETSSVVLWPTEPPSMADFHLAPSE